MGWKHNGKIEAPMWDHYMCKKSFWVKNFWVKRIWVKCIEESLGEKFGGK